MKGWFGDTSYFLALVNPSDTHHARAVALSQSRDVPVVTSAWVVTELADGLAKPPALRQVFVRVLAALRADRTTVILPADDRLLQAGLTLYESRPDKEWSLTDCVSFVVMQEQGIREALTADRHFQQAGFVALLLD